MNAAQILVTPNAAGALGGGFSFSAVNPASAPLAVGANQPATYFIDFFFEFDAGQGYEQWQSWFGRRIRRRTVGPVVLFGVAERTGFVLDWLPNSGG